MVIMDQVFEDFLNNKSDMLQASCECGENTYVFVEDVLKTYTTICRKCGKKILLLSCQNPDCYTGFSLNESAKEINLATQSWTCSMCNKVNHGLTGDQINNYHKAEIPPQVLKRNKSSNFKWHFPSQFKFVMHDPQFSLADRVIYALIYIYVITNFLFSLVFVFGLSVFAVKIPDNLKIIGGIIIAIFFIVVLITQKYSERISAQYFASLEDKATTTPNSSSSEPQKLT